VVRGALLRATQHLATAADYLAWRPLLHPVLARSRQTFAQATGTGVDLDELAATARALLTERPLTRPELGRRLAERWPGSDRVALAWSAQFLLPLVHPPPSGTWGFAARLRWSWPTPGWGARCPPRRRPTTWSCATWPRSARPPPWTSRPGRA
jgi:hypothetical protein